MSGLVSEVVGVTRPRPARPDSASVFGKRKVRGWFVWVENFGDGWELGRAVIGVYCRVCGWGRGQVLRRCRYCFFVMEGELLGSCFHDYF